MKMPRFQVVTCEGYAITPATSISGSSRPGISATVCDTLHQWREVATYRSEEQLSRAARYEGKRRLAVERAQEHADRLNEIHATELQREAMRRVRERQAEALDRG